MLRLKTRESCLLLACCLSFGLMGCAEPKGESQDSKEVQPIAPAGPRLILVVTSSAEGRPEKSFFHDDPKKVVLDFKFTKDGSIAKNLIIKRWAVIIEKIIEERRIEKKKSYVGITVKVSDQIKQEYINDLEEIFQRVGELNDFSNVKIEKTKS